MIRISHSHAEGTVVHGTTRGDGTNHIIKNLRDGWQISRTIGAFYLPRSRDHHANQPVIDRAFVACPDTPAARITVRHDGSACGCDGACLTERHGFPWRGDPWTHVTLFCASHADQYETQTDTDQLGPASGTYERFD